MIFGTSGWFPVDFHPIFHGKIYGFRLRFSLFCQPIDGIFGAATEPLEPRPLTVENLETQIQAGSRSTKVGGIPWDARYSNPGMIHNVTIEHGPVEIVDLP